MEKRIILATTLSLLVVIIWSALFSKSYHTVNKDVTTKILVSPPPAVRTNSPAPNLIKFTQPEFDIIFNEPEAAIKEAIFKDIQSYKFSLESGFRLEEPSLIFQKDTLSDNSISFSATNKEKRVIKRFIFHNSIYNIELELTVQNLSSAPMQSVLPLSLGILNFSKDPLLSRYQDITVVLPEKTLHLNARKDGSFADIKFIGLRDRYFCAIVEPAIDGKYSAYIQKISPQETKINLQLEKFIIPPGERAVQKFRIYLGPQDLELINQANPQWSAIMYYGTFNLISHGLLQLLKFLYGLTHNWGWAIIILSLIIYIALFPLTLKQMRSMKEMQLLQPRIEELRRTYKNNPQRLNKEVLELYREHKVNPFGGCLPLILQIPVFFALYQLLMRSVALKGAKFLWIKDLSEPDRLIILPINLPILGNEINILPILMTIGMFIQQRFSMSATQGTSAEQQKIMMIIFPLMFGFIFYKMSAGLVLYWFINSTLMLLYQLRITQNK